MKARLMCLTRCPQLLRTLPGSPQLFFSTCLGDKSSGPANSTKQHHCGRNPEQGAEIPEQGAENPEQGAENIEGARSLFFLSATSARRYLEALLLYPRTKSRVFFEGGGGTAGHRAVRLTHTPTPLSQLSSSKAQQSPGALPRHGRKQGGRLGLSVP